MWTVQLDPPAVASDRTMLDLNSGSIRVSSAGIDWGQAAITEYAAQQGQFGNTVADFVIPNRTVTIPLGIGMDDTGTEETARGKLQQKVAQLQREGGHLLRQRSGGLAMYADIVDAQLTIPDVWGETGRVETDVQLVLTCLPDFYGDEITLDTVTATSVCQAVLTQSGSAAVIAGDYPARCRIITADTSGNSQLGMLWGVRSRYYNSSSLASEFYEAEALTPLNAAASTTLSGASGGKVVQQSSLPPGAWVPILSTNQVSGGASLTHTGSYRVWIRAYSASAAPQFRLMWSVGSLASPVTNPAVSLPAAGGFYLLDLGVVQLQKPPTGTYSWQGVVQTMAANNGDPAAIDCMYLQPVAESAGRLSATPPAAPSAVQYYNNPNSYTQDSGSGRAPWTITPGQSPYINFTNSSSTHLISSQYGFSVPAAATIQGIEVQIARDAPNGNVLDYQLSLVKAGTIQTPNKAGTAYWATGGSIGDYGGPTDLWSGSWTPADINNAGFGVALSIVTYSATSVAAIVNPVSVLVYYTLGSNLGVVQDVVISSNGTAEIRTDGMFRPDPASAAWAPVSLTEGDLPRLPPSGLENRSVQLFAKPTRGLIASTPDAGLDAMSVQVKYRPCWLSRP